MMRLVIWEGADEDWLDPEASVPNSTLCIGGVQLHSCVETWGHIEDIISSLL